MMEYNEQDFLSLSGIQHFAFCRRQWALIHIEQQWAENLRTVEGELLHERAHDGYSSEKRKDIIVSRGMAVFSRSLGINGVCDIVEFVKDDDNGVSLFGREGKFKVYPVEYKRGIPKENEVDILQLAAQAMCLEDMLGCDIEEGFIFYGETRHRNRVQIAEVLRTQVKEICAEMHQYYERKYTPLVKPTKSCNACSLKDICLPKLCRKKSAKLYMEKLIKESDSI